MRGIQRRIGFKRKIVVRMKCNRPFIKREFFFFVLYTAVEKLKKKTNISGEFIYLFGVWSVWPGCDGFQNSNLSVMRGTGK